MYIVKSSRILCIFGLIISSQVIAEPYAERGTVAGGMSLEELDPDVKVPDSAEVPIPPPPDAKFISGGGDKYCVIGLRTELSVNDVCDYYKSKLYGRGYSQVASPTMNLKGACEIYKNGDMDTDFGVMVEKSEDPMFMENGKTLVLVTYRSNDKGGC
jgi:hypothetical protein